MEQICMTGGFVWGVVLSIQDIREREVSLWILLLGLVPGGAMFISRFIIHRFSLGEMIGCILPGVLLMVLSVVTSHVGSADGAVLCILGIMLGVPRSSCLFMMALLGASLCAFIFLICRKGRNTRLPFIPFLTIAYGVTLHING